MKHLQGLVFATGFFVPVTCWAAATLDGTWKLDLKTAKFGGKPDVVMLKDGVYECKSCVPPIKILADGKPHPVTSPYFDTGIAKIVGPTEIDITHVKSGKVVFTETIVTSGDGKTITFKGSDSSATTGAPVAFDYVAKRVGKAPPGAAAISGEWMATGGSDSDNALLTTYTVKGDMLGMTTPTGQSYTAKINGKQVPFVGDPGISTVSVKKVGKAAYKETDFRDGKALYITTTTLAADGKTATIVSDNIVNGEHMEAVEVKQ